MSARMSAFETTVQTWAQQQWGTVDLGDVRLNRRAVAIGARMAAAPDRHLPQQMADRAQLVATYRLLDNSAVGHPSLSQPHWQSTRQHAGDYPLVLLIQDVSTLDYTHYAETMTGLGPVGNGGGRGLLLHTTLAVVPSSQQVLGLAHQHLFVRRPNPRPTQKRRPKAERESRVWGEAVTAIGGPPEGSRWVMVADAGADVTDAMLRCRRVGMDFTLRAGYERRLVTDDNGVAYLLPTVRRWTPEVGTWVDLPAQDKRPARRAHLQVSFGCVAVRTPKPEPALRVWIVRVWEVEPPDGAEALEWLLTTSVAVETPEAALERVAWYRLRWLVEDYHQCLKTGCQVEHRDFEDAARIERLLGFLAIIAVRLLQLRQAARLTPDAPATDVVDPLLVQLLAARLTLEAQSLTLHAFWRGVAQLGGFVGRRRDGEPGWKTLWRGWMYLDTLAQGVRLAAAFPSG